MAGASADELSYTIFATGSLAIPLDKFTINFAMMMMMMMMMIMMLTMMAVLCPKAGSQAFTPPGDEMSEVVPRCLPHR